MKVQVHGAARGVQRSCVNPHQVVCLTAGLNEGDVGQGASFLVPLPRRRLRFSEQD